LAFERVNSAVALLRFVPCWRKTTRAKDAV
jgi:hypothetical protein